MGKSKLKRKRKLSRIQREEELPKDEDIPIPNLPRKFLKMNVKSGTKIRNVLEFAIKEFPNYNNCVVWSAAGHGIGKALSCVEIFKKKHEGLHQMTKLRYIESKKSLLESRTENDQENQVHRCVPEIHIMLAKEIQDKTESGYQPPGDDGSFPSME